MQGLLGFAALAGLAWLCSENRRAIMWRTVAAGFALQWALAGLLIGFAPARQGVMLFNRAATALQDATDQGSAFLFGYLGGAELPFTAVGPGIPLVLAFKILPLVLVISALGRLLYHWGVLQRVTQAFAWLLRRGMGIDGPLAFAAAAHVFVGMVEAPLLIRPWLMALQRGELFAVMSCGMAGVAGTVMLIYAAVLGPVIPDALGTIIVASVISTPAALAVSALMVPFAPPGRGVLPVVLPPSEATGSLDAIVQGTADGVGPLVGITTMLLVTLALVGLVNAAIGWGAPGVTLQSLAAVPFRPVAWLIGVPWAQTEAAALLLGTKLVLNEFVAYLRLAALPPGALDAHSRMVMTYALCGFANFGSLGILVGGMGAMVPGRRAEIAALGLRSVISGTIATCLSGAVAGILG